MVFEGVITNDSIAQMKGFIRTYSSNIFASEYVDILIERLHRKDIEAFKYAKSKTKSKVDFQNYIDEFGAEALYLKEAKERIIELGFYWSASNKVHYEEYLNLYENRNGLMIEEAKNKVAKFIYNDNKREKYTDVINSVSIKLCEEYLKQYEHHKDEQFFEVEKKWKELIKAKKANDLFLKIQTALGKEKLILCRTYIADYGSERHIEQVKNIEESIQAELDSNDALDLAVKQKTIDAFVNYKANHQHNHNKADDYILFLEKRQIGTEEGYRDYLFKCGDNGFNALEAKDGISFCQVAEFGRVKDIQDFLSKRLTDEFVEDGNKKIQELKDLATVDADFEKVRESEDPNIHTNYLRRHKGKNEDYDRYVIEDYERIQRNISDSSDFKVAKKSGQIPPLLNYIHTYGEGAIHFEEATKLLRERCLGITEKDINVLEKMDKNSDSIDNLSAQIAKSVANNSEVMTQFLSKIEESGNQNVQAFSTLTSQLEKAKEKENSSFNELITQIEKTRRSNIYVLLTILFVFAVMVILIYLFN